MSHVRVGVAGIIRRGRSILMGKRRGSHGAGTWSFPGGHIEWNESVAECIARETLEETGLRLPADRWRKWTFTNDIFTVEDRHYVTLYMEAQCPEGEPALLEPTKCEQWDWFAHAPDPLFLPTKNLLRDGSDPWRATTMIPAPIPQARR